MKRFLIDIITTFLLFVAFLVIIFLLGGCRSTKSVYEHKTDTVYLAHHHYKTRYDSVFVLRTDSTVQSLKNDTVIIQKWRTEYVFKQKNDTIVKNDTVYISKVLDVKEKVVKKYSWFDMPFIAMVVVGVVILLIFLFKKN